MRAAPTADLSAIEQKALAVFLERDAARFGDRVARVILYGSKARGDDSFESDVDILVLFDDRGVDWEDRKALSFLSADIHVAYGVDISAKACTVREFEAFARDERPFYAAVSREGVALWPPT